MSSAGGPEPRPGESTAGVDMGNERVAGRYRLERLLGEGGTAAVYAAVDVVNGQRVALKRLLPNAPARARTLFEREYEVLVSLRHPSIVQAYEYGHDGDNVYYTMELITGSDLRSRAPLPWRATCAHVRDVASILGLLHARGLLHRDLSARNLLYTADGRLKLIDFGAVAAFGPSQEIVGTPPFVAPEALAGQELDQRYDLFSLGALAYWLMTGTHAYPARSLRDLPRMWRNPPAPISSVLHTLGTADQPEAPPELDELLEALLRTERSQRPGSTVELIDRLNSIADLAPEAEGEAARGYLESKAFVGRTRERRRLEDAMRTARDEHRGQVLMIEGPAGMGRTRLLSEAATLARLGGALTIAIEPTAPAQAFATVMAAGRLALASAPAALADELALPSTPPTAEADGELAALMKTLEQLFIGLCRVRPVVVLVDDLHLRDPESQALFLRLEKALEEQPIVWVLACESGRPEAPSPALARLRGLARRLHLAPLSAGDTSDMLRSIFGRTPYLERLASRLHRASEGHPAHCLELARHLVQCGAIRYEEGAWALPAELHDGDLPATRAEGHRALLARLSPEAHALARCMSIPHRGDFPIAACRVIAERLELDAIRALSELERAGVLRSSSFGLRFAHADVQATLAGELSDEAATRAHLDVAAALTAGDTRSVEDDLRAALHYLHGGDDRRAFPLVQRAAASLVRSDEINATYLRTTSATFVELDALLSARGDDDYARVEPVAMLSLAGYFDDKRYAFRYGDEAVEMLARLLCLPLAARLSPVLGRGLSLGIALGVAGVRLLWNRRRGPGLVTAIRRMMQVCSALSGTAACCIDPIRIRQLANRIKPFKVFGRGHAAHVTHRFIEALRYTVEDRPAHANRKLRSLIALLESDQPITELEPSVRQQLLAGCLFALGVNVSWREGDEVLQIAARLEGFGALYQLSADQLRSTYHAHRGDLETFERYRKRVELHAVVLGTSWQVETWAAENNIPRALRLFDVMLLKRARQELNRLSQSVPSLERAARHAHGSYLAMRGRNAEAIPLLDDDEPPAQYVGWSGYRGTLARAYNGIGDHERARQVCLETLAHTEPEDLTYVTMTLVIQVELSVAEAGLGHCTAAHERLDRLTADFEPFGNRLTLVTVCEARVRACLAARDFALARKAHAELFSHCHKLAIPTLVQLASQVGREIDRAQYPKRRVTGVVVRTRRDEDEQVTRATGTGSVSTDAATTEYAMRALQLALESASADVGFLLLSARADGQVVHLGGGAPGPELLTWARVQMSRCADPRTQTMDTAEPDSHLSSDFHAIGRWHYCLHILSPPRQAADDQAAALVLGFDGRLPEALDPRVLERVARTLTGPGDG